MLHRFHLRRITFVIGAILGQLPWTSSVIIGVSLVLTIVVTWLSIYGRQCYFYLANLGKERTSMLAGDIRSFRLFTALEVAVLTGIGIGLGYAIRHA